MILRRLLAALLPLAGVLAWAGPAAADPYTVGSRVWTAAEAGSAAHWGAVPCHGVITYGWSTLPAGVIGFATWASPASAPADPSRFSRCHVDFDPSTELDPERFCTALAHEHGHLLGHAHVEDPDDLMAAELGRPIPECVVAMAPFQPEAGETAGASVVLTARADKPANKKHRKRSPRARPHSARRP